MLRHIIPTYLNVPTSICTLDTLPTSLYTDRGTYLPLLSIVQLESRLQFCHPTPTPTASSPPVSGRPRLSSRFFNTTFPCLSTLHPDFSQVTSSVLCLPCLNLALDIINCFQFVTAAIVQGNINGPLAQRHQVRYLPLSFDPPAT